jgi:fatty-acid peroxygenase
LLADGYTFIPKRCRRYHSDIFETRLLLRPAICVQGKDAARMFYHPDRFTRREGAMPITTLMLLQDKGSVQLLSGEAHRRRKNMFMSLMTPERIQQLVEITSNLWRAYIGKWEAMAAIQLHSEVQEILCRAVCKWAGVPLTEPDARQRTRELAAMISGAGAFGPYNWWAQGLRALNERWIRDIVDKIRANRIKAPEESAAYVIAWHRNLDGSLLDRKAAAVEIINILRPTLAVARFIVFAALALHEHPECGQAIVAGDENDLQRFVQEVRRFYPFFPLIGGRVREEFEWRGHRFTDGTWVLLDLYGTDHDARIWGEPEAFRPERFRHWDGSAFNLIPQGAGDHYTTHRCPGEWITIELMKAAVRLLTTAMRYDVPEQDLRINLSRMPTLPNSGFVIDHVKRRSREDRG